MNFSNISLSDNLKNTLSNLEVHNRMPHAIIISGGSQEQRDNLAQFFSMWAVCKSEEKPCYSCKDCVSSESKAHSDIIYAKPEGKTLIYSKNVIESIIKDAYIKPNQADRKVYVFSECDKKLPVISQNILLKTLEEPPQAVMFIMTCENSKSLLPTILSRGTVFSLENNRVFDETILSLAKEIALNIISTQEYNLLKSLNKINDRKVAIETLEALVFLFRDGLAISCDAQAVTDSYVAQQLCKRLTKLQYLKLIEISTNAIEKVNQNISLKLLCVWLCSEYRRISWQR